MRSHLAAASLLFALGCGQPSSSLSMIPAATAGSARVAAPDPTPVATAPAVEPAAGGEVLSGSVLEKIDAKAYSYLRLQTADGEVWAAVPKSNLAVGAQVRVVGAMWMQDFKSATMNRTWPRIAFGKLAEGAAPEQPAARPAGMFTQAAVGAGPGSSRAPPPDGHPVSAPRASGKEARTIAEVYAQKSALKDQVVRVSGVVVKETDQVMGKNWLHLRDGTGKDSAADLTFATADASAVGDTVVLSGVVHLDRDLGAGYHYDVLVEDAHIDRQ